MAQPKKQPKPERTPDITIRKPGGEGTVIIHSGCPGCGLVYGHTPTCPGRK